jgi:hypothetical protein
MTPSPFQHPLVQATECGHQGIHDLPVGALDQLGRGQLRRRQRIMDSHHPGLQVAPPTGLNKRPPHRRPDEPPALLRGRRQLQHGQGLRLSQVGAEGGQRPWIELPQRAAQRIHVPLAGPDQALMSPGQHLDRLGQRAVAGDLAVVMPVGPDQISQHLGIAPVGLGPRDLVRPR